MAVVGYARVSTEDQSTEGQILDLQKFGCTEIFRENASGTDRDRPQRERREVGGAGYSHPSKPKPGLAPK
jgi:hypothetical protein